MAGLSAATSVRNIKRYHMTLAVSSSFVGPIRNWKKSAMIDDLYTDQSGTVTNSPPAPWCSSLLHNPSLSFSGTIIVDDWQLDVRRWDSEVRPSRHSPGRNTQRMLLTGRSGCFESTPQRRQPRKSMCPEITAAHERQRFALFSCVAMATVAEARGYLLKATTRRNVWDDSNRQR